jgi:NodT family efflux transporter outer membrane factor (OMF) lipoprotein
MKRSLFILAAAVPFLQGCFLAPKYQRPPRDNPPAFKEAQAVSSDGTPWQPANPKDTLPRGTWWELFGDPQLNQLEQQVNVSNQNIKQAQAQFEQALTLVSQARSNYFPTVSAQPSVTRSLSPNVRTGSSNPNVGTNTFYDLPVTASWAPDIWGQVTMLVRSEKAQAQVSSAQLESMRLSMQAQLAADYFSMAAIDMQTAILNQAADSYAQYLELTEARFKGKIASEVDVAQAQAQLDATRAQASDLDVTRAALEHAIAVLIGLPPAAFSLPPLKIGTLPPMIPTGLPSQLLERRPDIASTERQMAVANQHIGIARSAYFPQVSLAAAGGYQSNSALSWIAWPARFWEIGASGAETILDFGYRRAVVKETQAAYQASVAAYRQSVLSAFQEVEDNLAALRLLSQEAVQQDAAVKAADRSLFLETARYKEGLDSYLNVIVTQNIALTDQRTAVQILGRRFDAAVALIQALGGGWDTTQLPFPKNVPAQS